MSLEKLKTLQSVSFKNKLNQTIRTSIQHYQSIQPKILKKLKNQIKEEIEVIDKSNRISRKRHSIKIQIKIIEVIKITETAVKGVGNILIIIILKDIMERAMKWEEAVGEEGVMTGEEEEEEQEEEVGEEEELL